MIDDVEKKRDAARSKMDAALKNATEATDAAREAESNATAARNRRDQATKIYEAARTAYLELLPVRDGYGGLSMPPKGRS